MLISVYLLKEIKLRFLSAYFISEHPHGDVGVLARDVA